jgi:Tol biopolymer transport system component
LTFFSRDPDLPHGNGSIEHVYVRDLKTGKVRLVDQTSGGEVGNDDGADAAISGNGRYVAFASDATNLPGGEGNFTQAYLRDLRRGKTILVSQNSSGVPQEGDAEFPHSSGDGRYVAFRSNGGNLPSGDGSTEQIYVRDVRKAKTRLVSKNSGGDPADAIADGPSVSLDGAWILFETAATNFAGNQATSDIFRAGPTGQRP